MPGVLANDVGTGITPDITTEDFAPRVWMCDHRVVLDDNTEPGRLFQELGVPSCSHPPGGSIDQDGQNDCPLWERINNYLFEGEQVAWKVLVMDKNGLEKISDVYATIGSSQGEGNDIEVNCQFKDKAYKVHESCNARILEEDLTGDDLSEVAGYWDCLFTVETPDSMYGEYWVTVEAIDLDGLMGTMDENEYWFLNPVIALSVEGTLTFDNVRPGTSAYSSTLLLGNDADAGSGVMMDMFISGTDFYDSSSSGAACPTTNQLALKSFRYFATNGAYSTTNDMEEDAVDGDRDSDSEGYVNIEYGIGFNNPSPFYENAEVIQAAKVGPYYTANVLAPGAEMALTFRLNLPEPCNGDFDTGSIYFWGEAI
jgi:hypothetical protein